jgi:hypothetical protein
LELIEELEQRAARITVGADKAYDNEAFVEGMRLMKATPQVAQNTTGRRSRIDAHDTPRGLRGPSVDTQNRPIWTPENRPVVARKAFTTASTGESAPRWPMS